MKNYIIVLTALIIVGCSREYKAQKVVKDFIKESSIGKKYKSIYFGALDSIYTGIFDYPEYKAVFDELRYAINTYDNYSDEQKLYDARWAIRNDPSLYRRYSRMYIWDQRTMEENMIDLICKNAEKHIANIQAKQDSISSAYYKLNIPKEFNGYTVAHDFSLKDRNGKTTTHLFIYQVDKELEHIIKFANYDKHKEDDNSMRNSREAKEIALIFGEHPHTRSLW